MFRRGGCLLAGLLLLWSPWALAQGGIVLMQSPVVPLHGSMILGFGVVGDAGAAAGAQTGMAQSEIGLLAPQPLNGSSAPWQATGTGPFGANNCNWDGPIGGPRHYLCSTPNGANGQPIIAVGGTGGASQPTGLQLAIGNTIYTLPVAGGGNVVGPPSSTANDIPIFSDTTGKVLADSGIAISAIKVSITTPTTFYVNGSGAPSPCGGFTCQIGHDNTGNGTVATPWASIAFATEYVASHYTINLALVTIQLADSGGTPYAGDVQLPTWSGSFQRTSAFPIGSTAQPVIQGHSGNPALVVVQGTSTGFTCGGMYSEWTLNDLTINSAGSAVDALGGDWKCDLTLGNIDFTGHFTDSLMNMRYGSSLEILGGAAISVTGSTPSFAIAAASGFILAHNAGSPDITITLVGNPAFSNGFIVSDASGSFVDFFGLSFSGSAGSGLKFQVSDLPVYENPIGFIPSWMMNLPGTGYTVNGPRINNGGFYYVNPSTVSTAPCGVQTCQPGSDTTGNGQFSSPFATLQKAANFISLYVDTAGEGGDIQAADGTYTTGLLLQTPLAGGGPLLLQGDSSTADNAIINAATPVEAIGTGTNLTVAGFKLEGSGNAIAAVNGATVTVGAATGVIDFGAITGGGAHINVQNATAYLDSAYVISGSAGDHILLAGRGYIGAEAAITVTTSGTPAFTDFISATDNSTAYLPSSLITYTATATGQRYLVENGSVIDTGGAGATFFPGNSAGSTNCAVTAGSVGTGSINGCGQYN